MYLLMYVYCVVLCVCMYIIFIKILIQIGCQNSQLLHSFSTGQISHLNPPRSAFVWWECVNLYSGQMTQVNMLKSTMWSDDALSTSGGRINKNGIWDVVY